MEIEITIRDMYVEHSDTVILKGKLAEQFSAMSNAQRQDLIESLETLCFSNSYVAGIRRIK